MEEIKTHKDTMTLWDEDVILGENGSSPLTLSSSGIMILDWQN
jgi:hypothetical protein